MKSDQPVPSLMIVDDIQTNLRLMCGMLENRGYRLRPFKNPIVALEEALEEPPDLFILDISMPSLNGYELCARLKAAPSTCGVPIIFLSALSDTERIVEGFKAGAVDYITKPFQIDEVIKRVETHLSLRRAQRELADRNAKLEEAMEALSAAQEQLVQSEKMASVGFLTAGIAHEINNPLNFILANTRIVRKFLNTLEPGSIEIDGEDLEEMKSFMEGVEEGGARIADIVNGLRIYARSDERGAKLYDPVENIEATAQMFRHKLGGEIALELEISQAPATLANPGRLNQVVANLLSNAIDAVGSAPEGREKSVRVRAREAQRAGAPHLLIEVTDTGSGIPESARSNIFEPFYSSKRKGMGLGLSISKSIVVEHGGSLLFESSPEGTTFRIWLPLIQA